MSARKTVPNVWGHSGARVETGTASA